MESIVEFLRYPPVTAAVTTLCMLSSLSLMLSGIPELLHTIQGKAAADPARAPVYAAMALDNMVGLWFTYLLRDSLGHRLRMAGSVLNAAYSCANYYFVHGAAKRSVAQTMTMAPLAFAAIYASLHAAADPKHHMDVLGMISTGTSIAFAASPLARLGSVLRLKDASSLSLPMSAALTLTAASWAMYGIILGNTWVFLPNAFNAVLGALQVGLILAYPGPGLTTSQPTPRGSTASTGAGQHSFVEEAEKPARSSSKGKKGQFDAFLGLDAQEGEQSVPRLKVPGGHPVAQSATTSRRKGAGGTTFASSTGSAGEVGSSRARAGSRGRKMSDSHPVGSPEATAVRRTEGPAAARTVHAIAAGGSTSRMGGRV